MTTPVFPVKFKSTCLLISLSFKVSLICGGLIYVFCAKFMSPLSVIIYLFIYTHSLATTTGYDTNFKRCLHIRPSPTTRSNVLTQLRHDALTSVRLRWRRDSTVGRADSANGYEVQFVDFFIVNLLSCDSEESVYPLCLAGCPQVSELSGFGPGCGCFSVCFEALSEGSALRSRQQQQQTPKRASAEEKCRERLTWAVKHHRSFECCAIYLI